MVLLLLFINITIIFMAEICKSITHLKENNYHKSELPTKILKSVKAELASILEKLFNHCVTHHTFPETLKIARIVPIHKSGNQSIVNNYRPILVLPTISKIFEKIIYNRVYSFFEPNNLF